jgi:hypothetical protein
LVEVCAVRPGWEVPNQGYPSLVFHGVATHLWRSRNGPAARYGA